MNILYIVTELNEGGAEHALAQVALRLARADHSIRIAALFDGDGDVGRRLEKAGLPVHDFHVRNPFALVRLRKARQQIREWAPDIVHSWLFHANLAARFTVPPDIPLIAAMRVVEPRRSHSVFDRLTHRRAIHTTCVSTEVAEFGMASLGIAKDDITVIENGVDTSLFSPPTDPAPAEAPLKGLTVARLTEQKGLDILIAALALLPKDLNWTWHIAGASPDPGYAESLKRQTIQLGIQERILWLGSVPRDEMPDLYRRANVFALPSRWEGQPNCVLEAMASGVPVLTSGTAGIHDLIRIEPGCLTLIEDESPESLQRAITDVVNDRERFATQTSLALNLAQDRSWDRITEQYLALYTKICARD